MTDCTGAAAALPGTAGVLRITAGMEAEGAKGALVEAAARSRAQLVDDSAALDIGSVSVLAFLSSLVSCRRQPCIALSPCLHSEPSKFKKCVLSSTGTVHVTLSAKAESTPQGKPQTGWSPLQKQGLVQVATSPICVNRKAGVE